jgi:hypothetical protein
MGLGSENRDPEKNLIRIQRAKRQRIPDPQHCYESKTFPRSVLLNRCIDPYSNFRLQAIQICGLNHSEGTRTGFHI